MIADDKAQEYLPRTGVLHVGRVVWLPDDPKPLDGATIPAWTKGIGPIWGGPQFARGGYVAT